MRLILERRPMPSKIMALLSPLIAVALTALIALIVFVLLGLNPITAFHAMFIAPISDSYGLGELLVKASPLILIAIGLSIGFRANVWNIGAEGQLVIGAIFGGGLALAWGESAGILLLPAMLVAGCIGGAAWAAIPALLKTRFNANEILVSLMLTYIAQLWLSYLIYGPWRDPAGFNFPQSAPLSANAIYPLLSDESRANVGILITLAAVIIAWVLIKRSFLGYQLTVSGLSSDAARYAGFSAKRAVWFGMLAGGITAGIAGVGELAGPLGQIFPNISPGYGFSAIIVAFLGRLQPVGIVLAGLLLSLLYLSGDAAQITLNLPSATTGLFQGLLLFFLLGCDVLIAFRIRLASDPKPDSEVVS